MSNVTRADIRDFLAAMHMLNEPDAALRLQQAKKLAQVSASEDDVAAACNMIAAGVLSPDSPIPSCEQSEPAKSIIDDLDGSPLPLRLRVRIANILANLGYRKARVEHTCHMPSLPSGVVIDSNYSPAAVRATHRRYVYTGPWEQVPDSVDAQADSFTFTHGRQP
uniref:Head-to-tail adaptor n=2 Tax=unclassified bacterial viruses TaxID=12333 RepID=A0AAU7J817_9VIRU